MISRCALDGLGQRTASPLIQCKLPPSIATCLLCHLMGVAVVLLLLSLFPEYRLVHPLTARACPRVVLVLARLPNRPAMAVTLHIDMWIARHSGTEDVDSKAIHWVDVASWT